MARLPETVRAFIAGASGSGKTTAAWHHYIEKYPRRILLDFTGEWDDRADVCVSSVWELSHAIRRLAPRARWTISVAIDDEELTPLVDYLIPLPEPHRSPIRAVHGAVLSVDEVDMIAPAHKSIREIRTLWRRSRHVGLSIVATTQRPEAVSREVTSQSQHALCLQLVEPSALKYMSEMMRCDLSQLPEWWRTNPHGGLWKNVWTGQTLWLNELGQFQTPSAEENEDDAEPLDED